MPEFCPVQLYAGGARLYAGGAWLYARGGRLYAGGVRLYAGGVRLYAGEWPLLTLLHLSLSSFLHVFTFY